MDTLQKLFNRLVGMPDPRPARRDMPVSGARPHLPRAIEMPACWRRPAKRVRGHSRREPL